MEQSLKGILMRKIANRKRIKLRMLILHKDTKMAKMSTIIRKLRKNYILTNLRVVTRIFFVFLSSQNKNFELEPVYPRSDLVL